MSGFVEAVAQARARTGKLGEKWPDTAKVIYSGMQLVLTGQAAPGRRDGQGRRLAGPMTRTSRRMSITRAARPASARRTARPASARRSGRRGEAIAKILFVVPAGLAIVVLFGYPVVKNLVMSFQDYTLATFFTGEAPWVGLRNVAAVIGDDAVHQGAGQHGPVHRRIHRRPVRDRPGCWPLFFHRNFPLNRVVRALFLLPWLMPLIVGSAAWRAILEQDSGILNVALQRFGIIDSPIPWLTSPDVALVAVILVNIWLGIPFNLTLLYSGLQDIPEELYEAARPGRRDRLEGVPAHHLAQPAGQSSASC